MTKYGIDIDLTPILGPGVFILSHGGRVTYIGKAKCLLVAIYMYRTTAKATALPNWFPVKRIVFDAVSAIPCDTSRARDMQNALIALHDPIHNRIARPAPAQHPFPPPTSPPQNVRRL